MITGAASRWDLAKVGNGGGRTGNVWLGMLNVLPSTIRGYGSLDCPHSSASVFLDLDYEIR